MSYNERVAAIIDPICVVGLISKIYGAAGQVVVRVWDNFPQDILDGDFAEPLWVEIDSIATPLFVASIDRQGTARAVVTFDDFGDENLSAMLVGKKIYSERAGQIEDEAPKAAAGVVASAADWSFLEGFTFLDTTSSRRGRVVEFIDNSLNPLLNVDFEIGGELLVPFAEPLIDKISRRGRSVTMHLVSGFFE